MKLRYELAITDMGNGKIAAVPVGEGSVNFHGMLMLDELSAAVIELLKEDTTPEKVHRYLKRKYPETSDKEIAEELVPFINKLAAEGLLITP
jgi:hypothetical protein